MKHVYNYENSMQQCEMLLQRNFAKLRFLKPQESSSSEFTSTKVEDSYIIMKWNLDLALKNIVSLKSEFNNLTRYYLGLCDRENNVMKEFLDYLECQETLRLKFLEMIQKIKLITLCLDNILKENSFVTLKNDFIQNLSDKSRGMATHNHTHTSVDLNSSSVSKLKPSQNDSNPVTELNNNRVTISSRSNKPAEKFVGTKRSKSTRLCTSTSDFESSIDVCDDVTVKTLLRTEKVKKIVSAKPAKRNESSSLGKAYNICNICCRNFKTKKSLKTHSITHKGLKNFGCIECGDKFSTKQSVKRHILLKHSPNHVKRLQETFTCNVCSRKFNNRNHLKRHMDLHEDLKPFRCAECGKSFARKDNMRSHILMVHFSDQQSHYSYYYCVYCNSKYLRKSLLSIHIQTQHSSNIKVGRI